MSLKGRIQKPWKRFCRCVSLQVDWIFSSGVGGRHVTRGGLPVQIDSDKPKKLYSEGDEMKLLKIVTATAVLAGFGLVGNAGAATLDDVQKKGYVQ